MASVMRTSNEQSLAIDEGSGLATALALGQRVMQVRLLEQEARRAACVRDELHLLDDDSGAALFRIPLKGPAFEQRLSAPCIATLHINLHEMLLRPCRDLPQVYRNQATTVQGIPRKMDAWTHGRRRRIAITATLATALAGHILRHGVCRLSHHRGSRAGAAANA